jgi:cytochrome c nitrite reductase small subunit
MAQMSQESGPAGPATWAARVLLAVAIGLAVGVGGFTFVYARGAAYLTNDPRACANCHVMRDYLEGWLKSSHHAVAVCNDCHTPHDVLGKYATKAANGFWHSFAFTTGRFVEPIRITERNRRISEAACRDCHRTIVDAIDSGHRADDRLDCVPCHGAVGHPH